MSEHYCNLNIRYDLPAPIWDKIENLYTRSPCWLGYGDGKQGEAGIPYWYGFDDTSKQITASVEPAGLQFHALNMDEDEWSNWISDFKALATRELGFKVGEIELGEVGNEIEWL
jgi:hypothetical protein